MNNKFIKVLEKCTKNLIGHSRLAFNNHKSNIDCKIFGHSVLLFVCLLKPLLPLI